MKAKIMLGLVVVLLGMAFAVASGFSGNPIPVCAPGKPCANGEKTFDGTKTFDGDPEPLCRPGVPCPGGPSQPRIRQSITLNLRCGNLVPYPGNRIGLPQWRDKKQSAAKKG